jgi:hypothetical protein
LSGTPGLGAVGGIQGGYNWQFAPAWVTGIEGDIDEVAGDMCVADELQIFFL